MRVLFVSDHFSTPAEPGVLRTYQLAKFLALAGDEVTVVAPKGYYAFGNRERASGSIESPLPNVRVIRMRQFRRFGGRISVRAQEYFAHLVQSTWVCLRVTRPDVMVAGLTPSVLGAGAYLVARGRQVPFVLDERDLALDAAGTMGLVPTPLLRPARSVERFLHRHADAISIVSRSKKEILVQQGVDATRIVPALNGYEALTRPEGLTRDVIRRRHDWTDRIVVIYVGGFGSSHDLATLLDASSQLPTDRFLVALLGTGEGRDDLEATALHRSLPVQFLEPVPKQEVEAICAAADIAVLPLPPGGHSAHVVPTKLFDYMASGRPVVIAMKEGEATSLVRDAGAGIVVPPGDASAVAQAVLDLADDEPSRRRMGDSGQKLSSDYRTDNMLGPFRQTLLSLAKPVERDAEIARIQRVYRSYDLSPREQRKRDGRNPGQAAILDERWRRVAEALKRLPQDRPTRVLDVGCGAGSGLAKLSELLGPNVEAVGVDILPDRLDAAAELLPDAALFRRSGDDLPFADRAFDVVHIATVFSSVVDTRLSRAIARECLRVLSDEGVLICYDVRLWNPTNRNTRAITSRTLRDLFAGSNLQVKSMSLLPPLARRLGRLTEHLYHPLAAIPVLRSHNLALITRTTEHNRDQVKGTSDVDVEQTLGKLLSVRP
jgi:glycosyltransferase involved in cell wall biosynthesis/ubiquinone/menaquinone biosynthesis C-methylase UbiE